MCLTRCVISSPVAFRSSEQETYSKTLARMVIEQPTPKKPPSKNLCSIFSKYSYFGGVNVFLISSLEHLPLSLQLIISSGTSTTQFLRTSTTTTIVGWLSRSLVTTTSTPEWPSPRVTARFHWTAKCSWGRLELETGRLSCRPTATWTAKVRSRAFAQPHRERWSHWRKETSSVSG